MEGNDRAVHHVHAARGIEAVAGPGADNAAAVEVAVGPSVAPGVDRDRHHRVAEPLRGAKALDGDDRGWVQHVHGDAHLRKQGGGECARFQENLDISYGIRKNAHGKRSVLVINFGPWADQ